MKPARFILSILLLNGVLVAAIPAAAQKANPQYSSTVEEKIKKVENSLSGQTFIEDSVNTWNLLARMKENNVPGLSIAVISNYKLEWARGYGLADITAGAPVTPQTLFQAASISKSLNGVGVLKLAQQKKLDLYGDINNYLYTWKFPYDTVSHGRKISVANLLSHTAGLTVHGFGGYEPGDTIPSLPELLDGKPPANSPPVRSNAEPGAKSVYSGGGTSISQMIVMDLTKKPYDLYMQEEVLKPMGMNSSTYGQPPSKAYLPYLSTGHRGNGKPVARNYHIYPEQAAAGLWTNPVDLSTYIIETQLSLQGKSNKVLSREMTKLRLTPYIDSNAALGVFIVTRGNEKYFSHGGANEGFRCQYYGSLDGGNGVVVMVNSDNGDMMDEVINSVAQVYDWKDFFKPNRRKAIHIPAALYNSYRGDYILGEDTLTIGDREGRPGVTINHSFGFHIYFSTEQDFFTRELPFDLKFEKDAAGLVTNIYFNNGREQRAKRL